MIVISKPIKIFVIVAALTAAFLFSTTSTVTAYAGGSPDEPEYNGYSHAGIYNNTAPPIIPEAPPAQPLTPPGTGTVIDNVTNENNIEFFTITSANGNIFFLIIDRQRDTENVYFLNAVTERDLLALAEESGDDINAWGSSSTPPPIIPGTPTTPTTPELEVDTEPEYVPEPEPEQSGGGMGMVITLIILALGGGAAGYYFKIYKPKQQQADIGDDEDFDYDEDYTEDDLPPWDIEDDSDKDSGE